MLNHRAALRGIVLACLAAGTASAQKAPEAGPLCLVAEYIYAGSRLLAVDRGSVLPTVSFQAASVSATEGNPGAPLSASVAVKVTTPGGCPTGAEIVVHFATSNGTAVAGSDYTAIPSGSLTIPFNTPSGTGPSIQVALTPDVLDEDDEAFGVTLTGATGATLTPPQVATVTILDDDPLPLVSVNDVSATEPALQTLTTTRNVMLSAVSGRTVTVNFTTADGTASSNDYIPASGTLTFPAGTVTRPVDVLILPDSVDEPNETYFVNLTGGSNVNLSPPSDTQSLGTIVDDPNDLPPSVSVASSARFEGDEGTNRMPFAVSLSTVSGFPITVNYATSNGTATTAPPADYIATSGQLSFAPGDLTKQALVDIVPDATPEPTETFFLNLSAPVNATLGTAQGTGFINNDDPVFQTSVELTAGARVLQDLRPIGGLAAKHWYRLGQRPRSSYEAIVDATSGDVGTAFGLDLKLIAPDLSTVLAQGVAVTPGPLGEGNTKGLRWQNTQPFGVHGQFITVNSTQCGTDCGPDDVYRIRLYDTTYAVPRFNNTGSQATVLMIQNVGSRAFGGTIDFWDANGVYLASAPFAVIQPRGAFIYNTTLAVPAQSGSMTIMHDGGYGDLVGKAVSVEPATGFSFDTPIVPRPR